MTKSEALIGITVLATPLIIIANADISTGDAVFYTACHVGLVVGGWMSLK